MLLLHIEALCSHWEKCNKEARGHSWELLTAVRDEVKRGRGQQCKLSWVKSTLCKWHANRCLSLQMNIIPTGLWNVSHVLWFQVFVQAVILDVRLRVSGVWFIQDITAQMFSLFYSCTSKRHEKLGRAKKRCSRLSVSVVDSDAFYTQAFQSAMFVYFILFCFVFF